MVIKVAHYLLLAFTFLACSPEHVLPNKKPKNPNLKDLPVNYQTVKNELLLRYCLECHSVGSESQANKLPFFPYSAILQDERGRWDAPAFRSRVIRAVTRADKHRMPPPGEQALSTAEINFLIEWIDAGKPEF